jgi:hypothetical protein
LGGVLVDFDTEMAKERAINEQRMVDLKNELMTEIYNLKQQFKDTMEESEKKMTAMFDNYMGNMLGQSREMLAQMDLKTNTLTDRIAKLMDTLQASPLDQNETTSPTRKQQCLLEEGWQLHGWCDAIQLSPNPCPQRWNTHGQSPARHLSSSTLDMEPHLHLAPTAYRNGMAARAGENK